MDIWRRFHYLPVATVTATFGAFRKLMSQHKSHKSRSTVRHKPVKHLNHLSPSPPPPPYGIRAAPLQCNFILDRYSLILLVVDDHAARRERYDCRRRRRRLASPRPSLVRSGRLTRSARYATDQYQSRFRKHSPVRLRCGRTQYQHEWAR